MGRKYIIELFPESDSEKDGTADIARLILAGCIFGIVVLFFTLRQCGIIQ